MASDITGEEDEITVQQTRAKLYTMDAAHTYKERGTGTLKIKVRKTDGLGARLGWFLSFAAKPVFTNCPIVMRAEGVYRLILNAKLFNGMRCTVGQDPKFVKLSVVEGGVAVHHAIRVGASRCRGRPSLTYYDTQVRDAKIAQDFVDQIHANIPLPPLTSVQPQEEEV